MTIKAFASRHRLWVVEDAAHAFPAAWRRSADEPWQQCGQQTSAHLVLLVLRQQDDHNRRGRDGGHR